jgi:hypothetical protein
MRDLSDVERDALQAAETLAGLAARLRWSPAASEDGAGRPLWEVAEEGGAAAGRVLSYLRTRRGPGDGAATAYPPRLGPWRQWCPPRGHLMVDSGQDAIRRFLHGDPGE